MTRLFGGSQSGHYLLGLLSLLSLLGLLTTVTASPVRQEPPTPTHYRRSPGDASSNNGKKYDYSTVGSTPPEMTPPSIGDPPSPESLQNPKAEIEIDPIYLDLPVKRQVQMARACGPGLVPDCCKVNVPGRSSEVPNDSNEEITGNLLPRTAQHDPVARQLVADNNCPPFQIPCCVTPNGGTTPSPPPKRPGIDSPVTPPPQRPQSPNLDGGPVSEVMGPDGEGSEEIWN